MKQNNLILLLETATASCSVALAQHGIILAQKEQNERNIHASHITLFIEEVMHKAQKTYSDLNAIAISEGPGSYTGLRIASSTAKGLCFALDIPLIAINTLHAMTAGLLTNTSQPPATNTLLCPMIDARRMEVYTALFDVDMLEIETTQAKIIDETSFDNYLNTHTILFFGDGSTKFESLYSDKKNAIFVKFENSASHLAELADYKLKNGIIEDIAYFEPYYLKNFVPTQPKKNL